jgi:hypothetical protein
VILSICLISQNSHGASIELQAQAPAPFHGILMDIPTAQQVYANSKDHDRLYLLDKSYEDSIDLYKKNESNYNSQIDLLKKDNTQLSTALAKEQSSSGVIHVVYFVLGVVTTGLVVYVFKK